MQFRNNEYLLHAVLRIPNLVVYITTTTLQVLTLRMMIWEETLSLHQQTSFLAFMKSRTDMLPFIKLPGFRKQSSIRIPKHDHLSLARVMQGSSDRIRWAWEGRRRSSGHVTSHVIRLKTKAREIFIRLGCCCQLGPRLFTR